MANSGIYTPYSTYKVDNAFRKSLLLASPCSAYSRVKMAPAKNAAIPERIKFLLKSIVLTKVVIF
jgi:hypothetical protein